MTTEMQPERWLLAARLSRVARRDRDREDIISGIQTQDQRGAEWAKAEGHVIVKVTRDRNVSGSISPWERPDLGPWLSDPEKIAQYDGIVAYDVKRVSRDYADVPQLRKWAEKHGKKLYVIKDRLRWPDPRDGTLWGVLAERAYEERRDMIEATTRELTALKTAARFVGRRPWGYTSEGEKYNRRLVPTEDGMTYIRPIFEKVAAGETLEEVAAWLNTKILPPLQNGEEPAGWWPRTIGFMIRNRTYLGRYAMTVKVKLDDGSERTDVIEHRCPRLVDPGLFKRANDRLDSSPRRGPGTIDPENRAMLRGAITCGNPDCTAGKESPMYRVGRQTKSGKQYAYYRCTGRGAIRKGCGNSVPAAQADHAVNGIMAETFNDPVMEYRLIKGNADAIENARAEIYLDMQALAARRSAIPREQYKAEEAVLEAREDEINDTTVVADDYEPFDTGVTYADEWGTVPECARGAWLVKHRFTVRATREFVSVARNGKVRTVRLG